MKIDTRELRGFFYSQYFSDGIRTTLGILLPALVLSFLGKFDQGVLISVGALCVSVVDTPGPVIYKRNAMAVCCLCIFLTALATGFARLNVYTLGAAIAILTFVFSMLAVYGTRAAAIGTGSLLMMILMIENSSPAGEVFRYSLIVTAGGVWYLLFSILFFTLRPYRAAQQALGESIMDIVKFLKVKADFYQADTDIDENYSKLVSQQIQVSQHQDAVREQLFKSRVMVRESTNAGRVLVLIFIDLVDLYEQILATHYDYGQLRNKFGASGILTEISELLYKMAQELENTGFAVLSNRRRHDVHDFIPELEQLKIRIDTEAEAGNLVLKKILINLRDLAENIRHISNYYNSKSSKVLTRASPDVEYSKFVTHQDYAPQVYLDNLSFSSASFRHAVRVSLACIIGFVISRLFVHGHHSYWVLLTIVVILKPGFSLSRQRNYQRLIGTICGGLVGVSLLLLIHNKDVLFIVLIVLMIATYSFIRLNYVVAVIFTTPYVLILFKFLGVGQLSLVEERVIDTIIGSAIAFAAIYLILPRWEFEDIKEHVAKLIYANTNYLAKIAETLAGKPVDEVDYKLARKDVYVKSGNVSAMFERMATEPKSKQRKLKELHRFIVLSHILSSYLANLASDIFAKKLHNARAENIRLIRKSITILNDDSRKLGGKTIDFAPGKTELPPDKSELTPDEALLKEQLGFVNKISYDIDKVTNEIMV
ncbi:MAG TPA: FUSC family membrane protein [Mucilaginibacter sp.]|nr:FUSC family membrane protein [Mucilaginibacter sp.]